LVLLLSSGCAEVWWKPMTGADELDRDRLACRAKTGGDEAFETCMADLGWWHSKPKSAALVSDPAVQVAVDRPSEEPPPDSNTPRSESRASERATDEPVPREPDSSGATDEPVPREPEPREPDSSGAKVFWKLGASTQELSSDEAACLARSGLEPERASGPRWGESQTYDACMRDRGWRGGRR
jgi:hypothetical protein